MDTSHHAPSRTARAAYATAGIVAAVGVCEAADLAAQAYDVAAGAAVITAVLAGCWILRHIRPVLHPVPARPSRPADQTERLAA